MSAALHSFLRAQARRCVQPPVARFGHPWIAPMPPSGAAARWLRRAVHEPLPEGGDRFAMGDYSLGLFHHDVAESAIALAREPDLVEACLGSLLCFLDCAGEDGCIHRIELPHAVRDGEPAKPVVAQLALRVLEGLGEGAAERFERERVLERLLAFVRYLERTHVGAHGLFLTPSARASGFDSDLSTAGLPERVVEGPDTNAFMVLEYRALAALAGRLAREDLAAELEERAEELGRRIDALLFWEDEHGGFYRALRSDRDEAVVHRDPDGELRPIQTWTGLLPLYAGVPSADRAAALARRLLRPEGYWGPRGVRTVPADSPFFQQAARVMVHDPRRGERGPVSNWTGPVWTLSSYYLARGLSRYGFAAEAAELDRRTMQLLSDDLDASGTLHECYDDEGRGLWPMHGVFVSWNVLALVLPDRVDDPVLRLGA